MTKVELEAKVGALTDEISFLRCIYEEVGTFLELGRIRGAKGRGGSGQVPTGICVEHPLGSSALELRFTPMLVAGTGSDADNQPGLVCGGVHGQQPAPGSRQHHRGSQTPV